MIEDTVAHALLKAMKSTRGSISPVLAEHGVHPGQDLLLPALWREDGATQTELAVRPGIEAPTASKALRRLERVGHVYREAGRGRSRRVYLTAGGGHRGARSSRLGRTRIESWASGSVPPTWRRCAEFSVG